MDPPPQEAAQKEGAAQDDGIQARTKSIEVKGYVLLPDGSPAAGEIVEVLLEMHTSWSRPSIVTDRYEVERDGTFGGMLAIPIEIPGQTTTLFRAEVRSSQGYATAGFRGGITLDELIEEPCQKARQLRGHHPYLLELRLRPVSVLSGQVVSPSGKPQRATLCVYEADEYEKRQGVRVGLNSWYARHDGRFDIPLGHAGDYVLLVKAYGTGARCLSVEIDSVGQYIDLGRIVVEGEHRLSGYLVAAHGAALPGIWLAAGIFDPENESPSSFELYDRRLPLARCKGLPYSQASTDAEGAFSMTGMAEGNYTILLSAESDVRLGHPPGAYSTGRVHVARLPTYPFEVLVQDQRGIGVARVEVTVVGLDGNGAPREDRLANLKTDAEGLVLVPWATPGRVLIGVDNGHGEQMETHYIVPSAGCVRIPRCVVTTEAIPGQGHGAISVFIESEPATATPVQVNFERRSYGTILHRGGIAGEEPIQMSGLAAGAYEVTVATFPTSRLHFVLPDEGLSQVVEVGEGGFEHVSFTIRLGGRFKIRLKGDRRTVGGDRWTVHRLEPDGRAVLLSVYQPLEGGGVTIASIQLDEWWTVLSVLEPGLHDLELRRNGTPFESTQVLIQPGVVTDWDLQITE